MVLKKIARLVATAGVVSAIGLGATVSPAAAAQNNSYSGSYYYGGSTATDWQNYTRSHTSKSNITYRATGGNAKKIRMDLRYTSNYVIFSQHLVGLSYGTVTLASNWGPTKFNVGLNGGAVSGTTSGTLYY